MDTPSLDEQDIRERLTSVIDGVGAVLHAADGEMRGDGTQRLTMYVEVYHPTESLSHKDLVFYCHAKETTEFLLGLVDSLRAENTALRETIDKWSDAIFLARRHAAQTPGSEYILSMLPDDALELSRSYPSEY